jgi:DNA modification methylase
MTDAATETPRTASVRRFGEVDWDFPDQQSESPFSDIHWHPCRFPSQIPAVAIGRLTAIGDAVLDPFVGSGTTLVEAQRLGRGSVGIDINPIACLVAQAKTLPADARQVAAFAASTKARVMTRWDEIEIRPAPTAVQLTKWYTPTTRADLQRLWGCIHSYHGPFNVLLRMAFSAILLSACREIRHWGYVCDNSSPKSDRERDVRRLFCDVLDKFAFAYKNREAQQTGVPGQCRILEGDAATVLKSLPDRSFSCFVTSPPYFGVTDYVKAQRLSMEWFGFEIEPSRKIEIGARSKRHRLTAAEDYVSELGVVFENVYRVLRRGAWGVVLFGQSPARPSAKDELLDQLLSVGFRLELAMPRQISDARRQYPSLKDESVLLMRKA